MHVKLVGTTTSSFEKSKKTFINETIQSSLRSILTPRCFSCKKIQTKAIDYNNKNDNDKQKSMHLLKNPNSICLVVAQKSKHRFPLQCLRQPYPIESLCLRSLSLNVRLYRAIMPPLTNKTIIECQKKNFVQLQNKNQSQNKKIIQPQYKKTNQFQNKKFDQFQKKNLIKNLLYIQAKH